MSGIGETPSSDNQTHRLINELIIEQRKTNEILTELADLTRNAYKLFNSPLGKLAAKSGRLKM